MDVCSVRDIAAINQALTTPLSFRKRRLCFERLKVAEEIQFRDAVIINFGDCSVFPRCRSRLRGPFPKQLCNTCAEFESVMKGASLALWLLELQSWLTVATVCAADPPPTVLSEVGFRCVCQVTTCN